MYLDTYTSRYKIYNQIPLGSKVLEIGCGSGQLANILTLRKKCSVYCVEKDPVMAAIARSKCVEMLNVDVENWDLLYTSGFFDCIILGNVLEHMVEPASVLVRLKKFLSDDGFLIYSVPNVVNWYSRMTIFFGEFEYAESGIFDKAHLRFFDLSSAKKLAESTGYRIISLDVTPSIYLFKGKLNFLWYRLALIWKNLFADEFIIQARKTGVD